VASQELLDGLNHALNREVSTFLRYILQSASIDGAQWESVRELYDREVNDEVGHAKYLAQQIVLLGGKPKLDPDLTPPPDNVETMLERDIAEEHKDVEHYRKLAELADTEGLMGLKLQMEEQAADESNHGQEMQRMLGV
jgi:bacterioferritin